MLPFIGRTKQDTMLARLQGEAQRLRQVRPELNFPEAVEGVLAKGMARDRNKRYRTAPEFATALINAVSGRSDESEKEEASSGGAPWWKRLFQ